MRTSTSKGIKGIVINRTFPTYVPIGIDGLIGYYSFLAQDCYSLECFEGEKRFFKEMMGLRMVQDYTFEELLTIFCSNSQYGHICRRFTHSQKAKVKGEVIVVNPVWEFEVTLRLCALKEKSIVEELGDAAFEEFGLNTLRLYAERLAK